MNPICVMSESVSEGEGEGERMYVGVHQYSKTFDAFDLNSFILVSLPITPKPPSSAPSPNRTREKQRTD